MSEFYKIGLEQCHPSWQDLFKRSKNTLKKISKSIKKTGGEYYPPKELVFNAFKHTDLDNVKVVIMGQDPYPQKGKAMGMAFSVPKGQNYQGSLRNIYKEVRNCYPEFKTPDHGDLTNWAKEGVLLLNSCLTVDAVKGPASHKEVWMPFIYLVLEVIKERNKKCAYVFWGKKAQNPEIMKIVGEKAKTFIAGHPSPGNRWGGFIGCQHFRLINEYLEENKIEPINWNVL